MIKIILNKIIRIILIKIKVYGQVQGPVVVPGVVVAVVRVVNVYLVGGSTCPMMMRLLSGGEPSALIRGFWLTDEYWLMKD